LAGFSEDEVAQFVSGHSRVPPSAELVAKLHRATAGNPFFLDRMRQAQEAGMQRRAKVELFEEIRREYEFGIGSVRGVARKLGVHRRQVRQALADAQPPARKQPERCRPLLAGLMPFIEAILTSDRQAPRKQRHTAHRIWQRIRAERPEQVVAESTIRKYVHKRKRELGWSTRTTCVPQSYAPGQEGQVDWYEAWAELNGEQVNLQVFALRSMVSGAAFHRAYQRATQQAFSFRYLSRGELYIIPPGGIPGAADPFSSGLSATMHSVVNRSRSRPMSIPDPITASILLSKRRWPGPPSGTAVPRSRASAAEPCLAPELLPPEPRGKKHDHDDRKYSPLRMQRERSEVQTSGIIATTEKTASSIYCESMNLTVGTLEFKPASEHPELTCSSEMNHLIPAAAVFKGREQRQIALRLDRQSLAKLR
jgi:hypothetical protein